MALLLLGFLPHFILLNGVRKFSALSPGLLAWLLPLNPR